jgi:hypothetical protein
VLTIDGILPQVQRELPEMHRVLGNLETTLQGACVLVSACQGSSYFRRFLRSDKHAEQFWRLREKIEFYLQLFPVISHIDTTRRLVRIINGVESPTTEVPIYTLSLSSLSHTHAHKSADFSNLHVDGAEHAAIHVKSFGAYIKVNCDPLQFCFCNN